MVNRVGQLAFSLRNWLPSDQGQQGSTRWPLVAGLELVFRPFNHAQPVREPRLGHTRQHSLRLWQSCYMRRNHPLLPCLSDNLRSREKEGLAGLRHEPLDCAFNEPRELPIAHLPIDLHPFAPEQARAAGCGMGFEPPTIMALQPGRKPTPFTERGL